VPTRITDTTVIDLGFEDVSYTAQQALLYAIAVGARADELDLVWERRARHALPTMATALGVWVTGAAADLLGYDRSGVLHVGQRLEMRQPLSLQGRVEMTGRVLQILDKGAAGIVHLEASCAEFSAVYTMYVPGMGGRGGERGERQRLPEFQATSTTEVPVCEQAAVLYRLTGDDHPVHVDPSTAGAGGHDRPILHGLCTLGMAVLATQRDHGIAPERLASLSVAWTSPAYPGRRLRVVSGPTGEGLGFSASQGSTTVCLGSIVHSAEDRR
jgi:acyl dehydratase